MAALPIIRDKMAKKEKKTRESQYDEILGFRGLTLKQCRVVGFVFPDEAKQHIFHFALMESGISYYLYDGNNINAVIVIGRDTSTKQALQDLAGRMDGKEYQPNLRLCNTTNL